MNQSIDTRSDVCVLQRMFGDIKNQSEKAKEIPKHEKQENH
jgi:hypothetical protein